MVASTLNAWSSTAEQPAGAGAGMAPEIDQVSPSFTDRLVLDNVTIDAAPGVLTGPEAVHRAHRHRKTASR
jgi:hypothetical protein